MTKREPEFAKTLHAMQRQLLETQEQEIALLREVLAALAKSHQTMEHLVKTMGEQAWGR